MTTVSHHDEARSKVSLTAFAVAQLRASETASPTHLIKDSFASLFCNAQTHAWFNSLTEVKRGELLNGIVVRTYRIDQEMVQGFEKGLHQVVVVGAGLDCRPWRLGEHMVDLPIKPETIKWFEVDFPEVLTYKAEVLKDHAPVFDYHQVSANVGIEDVISKLKEAGYDSSRPSIWLLEGFASYLTEEELKKALHQFSSNSAAGSKIVATFGGTQFEAPTSMHRFATDTPLEFLHQFGWREGVLEELFNTSTQLGRLPAWKHYYLVTASLHHQ